MKQCKGCGKEIVWAELVDSNGVLTGKKIPLDPKPRVYVMNEDGTAEPVVKCASFRQFMISHFIVCPDANRFSGSKGKSS